MFIAALFPLLTPIAMSVSADQPPKPSAADIEMAREQSRVAASLYRILDDAPGNLIFSPFSLVRALSMAREGARGETAAEIDAALRLPPDAGARFAALAAVLEPRDVGRKDERHAVYKLELATSMWGQRGAPFDTGFVERLKKHYASEIFPAEFKQADEVRRAINAWASDKTHGRIPEILSPGLPPPDSRLVLVDSVYFLAAWQNEFNANATKVEPFTTGSGATVQTPTMHRVVKLSYSETEHAQVIELPYELGAAGLVVVLPKPGQTLASITAEGEIADWTASLTSRSVDVALPKFRVRSAHDLKQTLNALGMKRSFQFGHADFSGIMSEPLAIGTVVQECFIAVDEKGTEAAAVTAVVMVRAAAESQPEVPVAFRADRPFLFYLRHRASGLVLFMGRVEDPTK